MSRLATAKPLGLRAGWRRLTGERHDLLVIGGGIHGAGVVRDAALRGLRAAVIDQGDWASGASSRSSGLLHGGLRYLKQGRLGMVREALIERNLHLRIAPGHVERIVFRIPPPPPGAPRRGLVRLGIALYGLLSGEPGEARFWREEPSYADAMIDDARFCLEVFLDARRRGALGLNYVEWLEWVREGDRITAARVRDRLTGEEGLARADVFVNTAGPWAEVLLGGQADERSRLRLTRGTHVVLGRRSDPDARLFFSGVDGRALFLLPFGSDGSLLGTTDLDAAGPVREPVPLDTEIRYLRESFARQFPDRADWPAVGIRCGLRPLLAGRGTPSDLSREHRIVGDPVRRLYSVLGGKYTSYRAVAERVVDRVERVLGRVSERRPTRTAPLPAPAAAGHPVARLRRAFGEEDAVRIEDALLRRTDLGARGDADPELLRHAVHLWRLRWGADEGAGEAEREAYLALTARQRAPLRAWGP